MAKRQPRQPTQLHLRSLPDVAELFGVSVAALNDRWRPRGAPLAGPVYDVRALVRWREQDLARQLARRQRIEQYVPTAEDAPGIQPATVAMEAEITLAEAKRDPAWADKVEAWRAKQLKNAVAVGLLVPWDVMLRALGVVVVKTRTRLEQIAYDFAQELPAQYRDELTRRLVEMIRAALHELSTFNPLAYLVSSCRSIRGDMEANCPDTTEPVSGDAEPVRPARVRRQRRLAKGVRGNLRRKKMG